MPKKNMGKVKRYQRSFYSSRQKAQRIAMGAAAAAVLFLLGYLVGPAFIDMGTHTWYTHVKGKELPESTAAELQEETEGAEPAATEEPAAKEPAAEPEPEQTPAPEVKTGAWSFVSLSALNNPERIAATAKSLAEQGVQYAVVPLKDTNGYIYYNSMVANSAPSVAANTIDAAAIAQAFTEAGVTPVASISMFRDPIAPYTDRDMGIHYQGTDYFWLDAAQNAGGKPWLDPYSDTTMAFLTGILAEVRGMGYKTLLLSNLQYPTYADGNCGYAGGMAASVSRLKEVIALCRDENGGGVVWLQYPLSIAAKAEGQACLGGGTLADLEVENLLVALPAEADEQQDAQLDTAYENAQRAGVQHIVVKSGDSASFY